MRSGSPFRTKSIGGQESGINGFIPVSEIQKERDRIEYFPKSGYPIAWAEGGNCVFIDIHTASIFYWDHEVPERPIKLAADFQRFIDSLEPFDINTIQLKPGQVKKVWVDPEFLKKLKRD